MEHAKTCQRPISLERRLAATYLVAGLVTAGLAAAPPALIFSVPPRTRCGSLHCNTGG